MLSNEAIVREAGLDEVALKPREVDLASVGSLPFDRVTVDFEGASAVPSARTLGRLADRVSLRVTVPVRADGFDPLGDDRRWADLPADGKVALVAGNPAYLSPEECRRSIAPRLAAALERVPNAWVGTEGIEQLALSTGATQFDLLAPDTERRVRERHAAGFDRGVAVYAPTTFSLDEDATLDALGPYVARRRSVADVLPADAPADAAATGRSREVLLAGCDEFALTGDVDTVRARVEALRAAGVDHVVGYPAGGLHEFGADG